MVPLTFAPLAGLVFPVIFSKTILPFTCVLSKNLRVKSDFCIIGNVTLNLWLLTEFITTAANPLVKNTLI